MLALALSAVAIVVLQTGICALECSGVLACTEQSSSHDGPLSDTDDLPSQSHCCHTNCHSNFVAPDVMGVVLFSHSSSRFAILQDILPDAPVREIDYPPQLS
jgi:hypothetical protein